MGKQPNKSLELENRPVGQSASTQENIPVSQYVTRGKEQASRPVSLYAGRTGQLASMSLEVKNRPVGSSAST